MLFAATFICICLLGYLAQTTGLCMFRGVKEFKCGNRGFLIAVLLSGVFSWVAVVFAHYFQMPLQFITYDASPWFLLGGFLFGLGTALNQGCGVSTLGRLSRGDLKMLATLLGWLAGWTILAKWQPTIPMSQMDIPQNLSFGSLLVGSILLSIWVLRGDTARKKLWFGMMGIGLLAGFLFLFESRWTPSGLLHDVSRAMIDNDSNAWPAIERYFLFAGLLLSMFIAAWRSKKFKFEAVNLKQWLWHILAGSLMGIGASLALGGNDTQLLLTLPAFSPAGITSVAGILAGIGFGLFARERFKA
jgi:uncharacterized membrane protein YedE/YeeE